MPVAEGNAAIIRHFFDTVLNCGEAEVARRLLAAGYRDHGGFRGAALDMAQIEICLATLRAAVGGKYAIEDLIADADKVVVRTRIVDDRPAVGRRSVFWAGGIHIFRLEGERIIEHWALETPLEADWSAPVASPVG
jgi:predicted SnoaL-like aldol condensation-catalyzing enzyme